MQTALADITGSPPGDAVALARALVAIDSRNPSLVADGPGEDQCARLLARVLGEWGFRVELQTVVAGRPNVIARIGSPGGRALVLNGHLDTVGVDGMIHAPWEPEIRGGRLYGRGSTDMKAGVAAMCVAAWRAAQQGIAGEVIVAAVVDEEYQSIGTRAFVASGVKADAAIVTEPTRLAICPAHKGFVWADLAVRGIAAHGSRYDVGVDAIALASMVVAELEDYQLRVLTKKNHPLLGRPSLHASFIKGGAGLSTYPDLCTVTFERRTIPGEKPSDFTRELEDAVARVRTRRPEIEATITPGFSQEPNDVDKSHPVVRALQSALGASKRAAPIEGLSCWTDAAILSEAGIPAVCFGPGDIAVAHAREEFASVAEIEGAAETLTTVVRDWFARS
jgi:acetylornithine deacetylase